MATALIPYGSKNYALKNAMVDVTKSTTAELVAAVAGKRIAVFLIVLNGDGATAAEVIFKSATTAISGALRVQNYATLPLAGPVRDGTTLPLFITESGVALNATETNIGNAVVHVWYAEVDP